MPMKFETITVDGAPVIIGTETRKKSYRRMTVTDKLAWADVAFKVQVVKSRYHNDSHELALGMTAVLCEGLNRAEQ
jgi:hypothetical protein